MQTGNGTLRLRGSWFSGFGLRTSDFGLPSTFHAPQYFSSCTSIKRRVHPFFALTTCTTCYGGRVGLRPSPLAPRPSPLTPALVLVAALALNGCSFLKPAEPTARHLVLTPIPAAGDAAATPGDLDLGLGPVKIPAYLFNTSFAVRKGINEIDYLPSALWAERLDTGFQRVLGANLAILLSTDHILMSAWQKDAVAAELYVTLEQFDVDTDGRAVLIARWRILSPGGDKTLKAGSTRFSRQGPAPGANLPGAAAALSELVAEMSRQIAQAIRDTTTAR